jgi:hypothetical protein
MVVLQTQQLSWQRASAERQSEIELSVASYFFAGQKEVYRSSYLNFALDPRLYETPEVPLAALDSLARRRPLPPRQPVQRVPSEKRSVTEASGHVSALASQLGVGHILSADSSCIDSGGPFLCRLGDRAGVIAFSPARVRGDSARLTMHNWVKSQVNDRALTSNVAYLLVRKDGAWVVVRVTPGIAT